MRTKLLLLISIIYINANAQINFTNHTIIDNYTFPSENVTKVLSFDVDGDSDYDIVYSSFASHDIGWLENLDGQGTYGSAKITPINIWDANIVSIFNTDIDGDNDMDIVFLSLPRINGSNVYSKIGWLENDGNGNFVERVIDTPYHNLDFANNNPSPSMNAIHANDMDGDGDMDIVTMSGIRDISWYENLDGLGNFNSNSHSVASGDQFGVFAILSADMDGDNDIDIISNITSLSDNSIKIGWFENLDGQGNFSSFNELHHYSNSSGAFLLEIGDLNGDDNNDISLIIEGQGRWLENVDNGSFTEHTIPVNRSSSMKLYDIDSDNDLDIVFGHDVYDNSSGNYLHRSSWYENMDGMGTYNNTTGIHQITSEDFFYTKFYSSAVADIDGDNDLDIISGDYNSILGHSVVRFRNTNNVTFQHEEGGESVSPFLLCTAIDLDNDNDLDFIASAYKNTIVSYENLDGTGESLGGQKIIAKSILGEDYKLVTYGDIDGDNYVDIVAKFGYDLVIFKNDGTGEFEEPVLLIPYDGLLFTTIKIEDVDNDGDNDIIAYYYINASNKGFFWHENTNGSGSFGLKNTMASAQGTSTILTGSDFNMSDIDGDEDLDLVYCSTSRTKWIENIDGNFSNIRNVLNSSGFQVQFSMPIDIDGDGDVDIIGANNNENFIYWFDNLDGQGNFHWQANSINTGDLGDIRSVHANDIDNDGDNDILVSSSDGIILLENLDGVGDNFDVRTIINSDLGKLFFADINQDNLLDFSTSNSWYNNKGLSHNRISGTVKVDIDNDGCDISDLVLENIAITTNNGNSSLSTFSFGNGSYQLNILEEGSFTTSTLQLPNYYISNPVSVTSNFIGLGNTDTVDFCIEPIGTINDLTISIYQSQNDPRPGFNTPYRVVYKNIGTTILSGSLGFEYDNTKLNFLNASETVVSSTSNTLNFDYIDLTPFETRTIDLEFNVFAPPTTNIDDELVVTATINPIFGDETEDDNVFTLEQTVIGSYDPNDITVLEGEEIFIEDADKYLHYLIRFQNTGTASAINVRVETLLDDKLDWTTMQLESLSHSGRVEIADETNVSFIFSNINLPDSTNDELNSHGYIAYKIKLKSDVEVGDVFSAVADIYFDFNPPIITNIATTEVIESLNIDEFNEQSIKMFPNPVKNKLKITSNQIIDRLTIIDVNGRILNKIELSNEEYELDVSNLFKGMYFLEIISSESRSTKKFMKN